VNPFLSFNLIITQVIEVVVGFFTPKNKQVVMDDFSIIVTLRFIDDFFRLFHDPVDLANQIPSHSFNLIFVVLLDFSFSCVLVLQIFLQLFSVSLQLFNILNGFLSIIFNDFKLFLGSFDELICFLAVLSKFFLPFIVILFFFVVHVFVLLLVWLWLDTKPVKESRFHIVYLNPVDEVHLRFFKKPNFHCYFLCVSVTLFPIHSVKW